MVLFNRHAIGTQYPISNITVTWEQLGYEADVQAVVRDLHAERSLGTFSEAFTGAVDIHDARALRITPKQHKAEYDSWRPWHGKGQALQAQVRSGLSPLQSIRPRTARAAEQLKR